MVLYAFKACVVPKSPLKNPENSGTTFAPVALSQLELYLKDLKWVHVQIEFLPRTNSASLNNFVIKKYKFIRRNFSNFIIAFIKRIKYSKKIFASYIRS